ncbi:hypothetical protein [Sphingomonas sp. PP-CE-1G-424]|uniref:hypothetical protein n=1 Tax=Sphingomonas sp. PP-CE-1G-424 TaxID=2135658 RepID=UPI001404CDB8|nr:hypothetical protein [Sphingomonas sp. PP-CE-1G-424]
MKCDHALIVARRFEPGRVNCWDIYSDQHCRWLDVIFASKRDAEGARLVLVGVH